MHHKIVRILGPYSVSAGSNSMVIVMIKNAPQIFMGPWELRTKGKTYWEIKYTEFLREEMAKTIKSLIVS